jgi:hypothetical protein
VAFVGLIVCGISDGVGRLSHKLIKVRCVSKQSDRDILASGGTLTFFRMKYQS